VHSVLAPDAAKLELSLGVDPTSRKPRDVRHPLKKGLPRRNLEVSMRGMSQCDAIESLRFIHVEGNKGVKIGVERGFGAFYGVSC
jgi:hypothetical protein